MDIAKAERRFCFCSVRALRIFMAQPRFDMLLTYNWILRGI